jgi:hypothetical protein
MWPVFGAASDDTVVPILVETGCQALIVSLGIRAASRAYSLAGLVPGEMLVCAWGLVLCAHGTCTAGRNNRSVLFPIKGLRGAHGGSPYYLA